ncbi:DNA mismatch endonuclease Vsr [Mesorhizobium sp. C277A]|uniref:very short patch repair endonuclease n=1 Tax=Mesorhizobium sp. C277A TaxID=2956827 RepID=UPI0003CF678D|nr:DNA mismatch endonuclease Vsr [Mesorhizobium sp. LSJC277A00]ESW73308.1 DNA mismatch repair protein Vsr [Mesorhizobium sp. LSJC277A00]
MTDIVDKETRSRMMAGIRGKDTKPETVLRRELHARGFRFRLHAMDLPGRPDLLLPKFGAVIFVHGCFWHRHEGCRYATTPATRPEFWQAKFDANVARDQAAHAALLETHWRVATVWECALRKGNQAKAVAELLAEWLRSDLVQFEVSEDIVKERQARGVCPHAD